MHSPVITIENICDALALPDFDFLSAHMKMAPMTRNMFKHDKPPREAGVLALLYPDPELHIVLTRRNEGLRGHSGQISFPGGQRDAHDISFTATAMRETCEELGICGDDITVLGTLSQIYIPPSNFNVYPTVGYIGEIPEFIPNPFEVSEVFSAPLTNLLDARYKQEEEWDFQNVRVKIPFYNLNGHKVWGATAVMLSEFEHRLRAVI